MNKNISLAWHKEWLYDQFLRGFLAVRALPESPQAAQFIVDANASISKTDMVAITPRTTYLGNELFILFIPEEERYYRMTVDKFEELINKGKRMMVYDLTLQHPTVYYYFMDKFPLERYTRCAYEALFELRKLRPHVQLNVEVSSVPASLRIMLYPYNFTTECVKPRMIANSLFFTQIGQQGEEVNITEMLAYLQQLIELSEEIPLPIATEGSVFTLEETEPYYRLLVDGKRTGYVFAKFAEANFKTDDIEVLTLLRDLYLKENNNGQ